MPDLSIQRRLAADIMGVGVNNVRFDPERIEDIEKAFRREEIKALIEDGAIYAIRPSRNSRGRWRILHEKRKKGRRRGHGSRKGKKGARLDEKRDWINRVRRMRTYIRMLRSKGAIDTKLYRSLYMKIKGGAFRDISSIKTYLKSIGVLKEA
ncbi:MAG: 50S ribosomal protein L19e [Desulfurococcales archaeon]|jgi:large subunit ribosomal protein L19e|nr:50S ribosomal protein L19e [Desulfurococcales archaeon]